MPLARNELAAIWPALPYDEWKDACATLHLWAQMVGKVRLVCTPWLNHSWHVPLYLSARGLTTGDIPSRSGSFELEFDFLEHLLLIRTSGGGQGSVELRPRTVADFYQALFRELSAVGVDVSIHTVPNEIADAIPFDEDTTHAAYDPDFAWRHWRVLAESTRVMQEFRTRFIGKCSPVHFFWGGFDLAVTRFSGRTAPEHPGGVPNMPDWVARDGYSHEVSSAGFWAGGPQYPYPLFYSYAYPEPEGYPTAAVSPAEAFYDEGLREFILPYEAVRTAADPDRMLLDFLQTTYDAAADLGRWDRAGLERYQHPREIWGGGTRG